VNESILAIAALGIIIALTLISVDTLIIRRIRRQAVPQAQQHDDQQ
jgi:hypothetical protein